MGILFGFAFVHFLIVNSLGSVPNASSDVSGVFGVGASPTHCKGVSSHFLPFFPSALFGWPTVSQMDFCLSSLCVCSTSQLIFLPYLWGLFKFSW